MKELFVDIDRWLRSGKQVAIARVVDIEGSGPRLPGAAMAICDDGNVAGSVSGGCIEGAVVTEALDILQADDRRVVTFGYSDDDAFAVGLTCGGTVHLFIEPVDWPAPLYDRLCGAIAAGNPVALATVIFGQNTGAKLLSGPSIESIESVGTLGDADLNRVVARDALAELEQGRNSVRHYGAHGEARETTVSVFIESFARPAHMLVFGAVDFTAALVKVAKLLGFYVTVCDAREVFATTRRFPDADEVIVDWPQRVLERLGPTLGPRDAVCVLTHDHKFDVPAVVAALGTQVGYLGVMGGRRTHAERVEQLVAEGVTDLQLERVMAPIGLDLGARTPEETAVSICAEIIARRTGRTTVASLSKVDGPIHT